MTPSRLSERLREVVRPVREAVDPRPLDGDSGERHVTAQGLGQSSVEETLGGAWQAHQSGRYLLVERTMPADARHGPTRIGDLAPQFRASPSETAGLFDRARPPFLFFDLETTGLNGGAGTYAFLIGVGSFDDDDAFVTKQYVMTRASHERPMLRAVAEQLVASGALVSFNGKSFDAPLLESRFLFHRLSWVGETLPHVDMLHPARRFWRAEGGEPGSSPCSLSVLERQVLGAERHDDVPGMEAPSRYFQFVRSGDARPLAGVLEHNRLDLVSLAGLMARLLDLARDGPDAARTGREAFALGGLYERSGRPVQARGALERALELVSTEETDRRPTGCGMTGTLPRQVAAAVPATRRLRVEVLRALARGARRSGRHDEAARWWRETLGSAACPNEVAREAAEALAVHHEHRRRDLESARAFAQRTLEITPSTVRHAAARHRLARLERKLSVKPTLLLGE